VLKISRILHAGYIFECEGIKIAFDPIFEPVFSGNCHAFPKIEFAKEEISKQNFSAVFISHHHDDHCSLESLNLLSRDTPIWLYCEFEELFDWIKELGFKNVRSLSLKRPVQVGPFKVTPWKALDEDVDCLFQVSTLEKNILNVVDSWIDEGTLKDLVKESPWDLILWPFQTMREIEVLTPSRYENHPIEIPHEWLNQLKALNPLHIIPSSCQFKMEDWSWYNHQFFPISYKQFAAEMKLHLPNTKVFRLDPGESLNCEGSAMRRGKRLDWIKQISPPNVDYEFRQNLPVPSTADVARALPCHSHEQTEEVRAFCESGILRKFSELSEIDESYFSKPREWRLLLFDCEGKTLSFDYRIHQQEIELLKGASSTDWLTEVPLVKLYAALKNGESLSSMYIRINDIKFNAEIENEIGAYDVVREDPLIRSLFTGVFGAYQKAQLRRINDQAEALACNHCSMDVPLQKLNLPF
jgi:hypothetical protein